MNNDYHSERIPGWGGEERPTTSTQDMTDDNAVDNVDEGIEVVDEKDELDDMIGDLENELNLHNDTPEDADEVEDGVDEEGDFNEVFEENDDLPTVDQVKNMKVAQLKELLKDAEVSFPSSSKKDDLIKIVIENNLTV